MGYKRAATDRLRLFFFSPTLVISIPTAGYINKKTPAKNNWGFQEPKTKIYETFYLQPFAWLQVLMIRTAAKIHKNPKRKQFFFKNEENFDILDKFSTNH